MPSNACPVFRVHEIETEGLSNEREFEARTRDGELLGLLSVHVDRGRYHVALIDVATAYQRCGVGTRLYQAAAQFGCEHNMPLRSDRVRSARSQAFWEKQVQRGRATCAAPVRESDIDRDEDRGQTMIGRGGCDHYVLACPAPDLSRRWRRRR